MPWSLILSLLPFAAVLGFLVVYEHRSEKRLHVVHKETHEQFTPVAKIANDLHKKKFGQPSTELGEVFPELRSMK